MSRATDIGNNLASKPKKNENRTPYRPLSIFPDHDMTIVSHKYRFIFLKTRKTAGSSIESWLVPHLGKRDMIATSGENWPLPLSFWAAPNPTESFPTIGMDRKRRIRRLVGGPKAFILSQHMSAAKVRKLVGNGVWDEYFKFCVVRKPWERMISLWRWRQHLCSSDASFDQFLDYLESDPDQSVVRNASDFELYTIDGRLAVDTAIDYDDLSSGFGEVVARLGIPKTQPLPHLKAGFRKSEETTALLSQEQIDRISRVHAREIELWKWRAPSFIPSGS